jgi:hypothetical protein
MYRQVSRTLPLNSAFFSLLHCGAKQISTWQALLRRVGTSAKRAQNEILLFDLP